MTPTVAQAIATFLESARLSPRTIATYRQALQAFCQHLQSQGLDPATAPVTALTIDHVVGFLAARAPRSPQTRAEVSALRTALTYLAGVRKFYAYLTAADLHPTLSTEKLALRLKAMRGRFTPPPPRVHRRDLERLINYVKSLPPERQPARELRRRKIVALVLLLARTGLRLSELCALRRQDIDLSEGTVFVFRGKNNKSRLTYFDRETAAALLAYWEARGDRAHGRVGDLPAFSGRDRPGQPGTPIRPRTVQALITTLATAAGLSAPITPHSFRHGLATELVRRRVRESVVQRLMGHANPATTQIYVHLVNEEVQAEYREAFGAYDPPTGQPADGRPAPHPDSEE